MPLSTTVRFRKSDYILPKIFNTNTMGILLKIVATVLNFINDVLHIEPIAILVDGVYWTTILLFGFPLAGVVALIKMAVFDVLSYVFRGDDIDPKTSNDGQQLAVLITGTDSGFGRELVAPLTARGFTVFCGCLHKESFVYFQKDPLAIPLHLDVTNDKHVAEAYKLVSEWLDNGSGSNNRNRHLHALVNNAGICRVGLIDWAKFSDFKACMDVNYFGMVRCVKQFLPIFKRQAAGKTYHEARIVNMVSMAGLFDGGGLFCPYVASKHAADAFTCNLQVEMKVFNVKVTAVNPTFHATPMANETTCLRQLEAVWNNCTSAQREEYGEGEC